MDPVTLARPYARAAFHYALDKGCIETWNRMLAQLAKISMHGKVNWMLSVPGLTPENRASRLVELAQDILDEGARNFLVLLSEYGRLSLLPFIAVQFANLKEGFEQEQTVVVSSAFALDENRKNALKEKMERRLRSKVVMDTRVDSSLIGGLRIQAGDRVYDDTLKSRLTKLANAIIA